MYKSLTYYNLIPISECQPSFMLHRDRALLLTILGFLSLIKRAYIFTDDIWGCRILHILIKGPREQPCLNPAIEGQSIATCTLKMKSLLLEGTLPKCAFLFDRQGSFSGNRKQSEQKINLYFCLGILNCFLVISSMFRQ